MRDRRKNEELASAIELANKVGSPLAVQCLLAYADSDMKRQYISQVFAGGNIENLRSSHIAPYILSFYNLKYIEGAIEYLLDLGYEDDARLLLTDIIDHLVFSRRNLNCVKHLLFSYMLKDVIASGVSDHEYTNIWNIIEDLVCISRYCSEGKKDSRIKFQHNFRFTPNEAADFIERFVRYNKNTCYREWAFKSLARLQMVDFIDIKTMLRFCDYMSPSSQVTFILPLLRKNIVPCEIVDAAAYIINGFADWACEYNKEVVFNVLHDIAAEVRSKECWDCIGHSILRALGYTSIDDRLILLLNIIPRLSNKHVDRVIRIVRAWCHKVASGTK